MTAVWKIFYFDVLDDIIDKYNNTFHKTIEIKPIDFKSDSYAEYNVDSDEKSPKFKVSDRVRISKYKNIFAKECTLKKKFSLLAKLKMQFHGLVINDLNGREIVETFDEKELQKTNQKEMRIEKVIKKIERIW